MREYQVPVRFRRNDVIVRLGSNNRTESEDRPCSTPCRLERYTPHRLPKPQHPMYQPFP